MQNQKSIPQLEQKDNLSPDQYEIQKILDVRTKKGRKQYKIHWKNYPIQQATWEPWENIKNCKEDINIFYRQQKQIKQKKIKKDKTKMAAKRHLNYNSNSNLNIIQISSQEHQMSSCSRKKSRSSGENHSENHNYQKQSQKDQILNQKQHLRPYQYSRLNQNPNSSLGKAGNNKNNNKNKNNSDESQCLQSFQDESEEQSSQTLDPVRKYAKYIKQLKKQNPHVRTLYKSQLVSTAIQTDLWFKQRQTKIVRILRCQKRSDYLVFQVVTKQGDKQKIQWIRNQVLKQLDPSKIIQFYESIIVC